MRKLALLLPLLLCPLSFLLSQTVTDISGLSRFSVEQEKIFQRQRAEVIEFAKTHNLPVRFEIEGVQFEMQYIDEFGHPQYYITHNADAAETISTDEVYTGGSAGLSLDGTGQVPREWDAGNARATHQEFDTRLTNVNSASVHFHATHVAGTIIASGVDTDAKGMAFAGSLRVFDWNNDDSEMAMEAITGALVSNHSYGWVRGWHGGSWYGNPAISTEEDYLFGFYDSSSEGWDQVAYDAPFYLIVKSAGNDRNDCGDGSYPCDGAPDGYDCIGQQGVAKNILTVGAVDDISGGYTAPGDVVMSSFSSWGPADDGRIKPDIVANGISLHSTWHTGDTDYDDISGTSMATPSVTGSISLLHQHYEDENGTGSMMRAATTKALVIHTADEAGTTDGPDYAFGWGLMNTKSAAEKITEDLTTDVITENVLVDGETYTRDIETTGTTPIRVTLCWTDPPGTPPAASLDPTDVMLVNDLDLQIENGSTRTVYYPWILDRDNPADAATNTTENNIDNVLMVDIASPGSGTTYTITVDHDGSLDGGSQAFSLIISGDIDNAVAPVADFFTSDTTVLVEESVAFTDASDNIPTSWSWTFTPSTVVYQNGTSSTSQNPEVHFTADGDYTVELTATNANGSDSETKTDYITVVSPVEWTGTVSDSWTNTSNWDSGSVPDETTHVVIPSGAPNYPEINDNLNVNNAGTFTCKSLKIENGGTVSVGSGSSPSSDMFIYGQVIVESGGTLNLSDDLDVQAGGELIITGGTVTNTINSGGFGDFLFQDGSGGYMTSGSMIINDYLYFASTSTWNATGGTLICAGDSDVVDIENDSPNVFLEDFVIEQDIQAIFDYSAQSLDINGNATMESNSRLTLNTNASNQTINVSGNVTFGPASNVIIYGGNTINVTGNATLESTSSGTASLFEIGTFNVTGTLTVQRYVTDDQWHLIASPVDNATANSLYFNGNPEVWLKRYLEATNTWEYITALSTPLPFGSGFAIWVEDAPRSDVTINFTGDVRNTDLILTSLTWAGDTDHGYNLVGNPFPCPISWDVGSWDTTNINGSCWVWQDGGPPYLYRNAQQQGSLSNGVIPMAQGFFVQANNNSPSLTIPADAMVFSDQDFYKKSSMEDYEGPPYVVFSLHNSQYLDEVWITFSEDCSEQFDNGWDVNKFFGEDISQLFIEEGQYKLSIDALPQLNDRERLVNLSFEAYQDHNYQLVLSELMGWDETGIFLEDTKNGQIQDMLAENSYEFYAENNDNPDRFLIHFNPQITSVEQDNETGCQIYAYDKRIYVNLDDSFDTPYIDINDIFGRQLTRLPIQPSTLNKIPVNLKNSYLIVRVSDNHQSTVKKVFIR